MVIPSVIFTFDGVIVLLILDVAVVKVVLILGVAVVVVVLILGVAVVVVVLILHVEVVATMVNVEGLKVVLTPILDIAVILITTPASPLPIELVATTENV